MTKVQETVRFKKPNRLDVAPYGTIYSMEEEGKKLYWIQIEPNPENASAEWLELGAFLHEIFQGYDLREDFIVECLYIYTGKKLLHESNLRHILSEPIDNKETNCF